MKQRKPAPGQAASAFAGLALLVLAGGALFLHAQSILAQRNLGRVAQPAPATHAEGSVYSVGRYPEYAPELAPGEGHGLVESFCIACHSTRYITMQPPLPAAAWEREVQKMIKTFGMPIPDEAAATITKYLQTHYTPETRKE